MQRGRIFHKKDHISEFLFDDIDHESKCKQREVDKDREKQRFIIKHEMRAEVSF